MKNPIIIIVGTRPDAIKLIPLYKTLKKAQLPTILCATFQHDQLLQQVLDIFQISPDINLNIMKKNQNLFYITTTVLEQMKNVYKQTDPSLVIVQGDTTTAFSAALAAFYLQIPIGHVEAGLRTGNIYAPYPEEVNRIFITKIANYHFAPTSLNVANLLSEGIKRKNIFCTGNTVVDALYWIRNKIKKELISIDPTLKEKITACKLKKQKIVLLTAHRRESFNGKLLKILKAIKVFSKKHNDVVIFYPAHPNPNVLSAIKSSEVTKMPNIYVSKPITYKNLIYLMTASNWIVTDSGGIQEEAISLGKKVLVLRDFTERMEGVWENMATLTGSNETLIAEQMQKLYCSENYEEKKSSIYGDGNSCDRITSIITTILKNKNLTATSSQQNQSFEII